MGDPVRPLSPRAPARPEAVSGYLPGLDGVRGVAILGVMAFHFGVPGFAGGLLGVDVFFVLSGFLVTSLLLGELARTGTISLRGFWARRARRLLPGLVVLLAGIACYAAWLAPSGTLGELRADALSTLAYVANWHAIIAEQNYFVHYGAPSPLLHTWSLAVEEQFYLVWPLVVVAVARWWGRRGVAGSAAVLTLASAAVCAALSFTVSLSGAGLDRLYYGTDTRAQELMVGALLAVVLPAVVARGTAAREAEGVPGRPRHQRLLVPAGLVGAAFVAWSLHAVRGDGTFLYRGGFLLVSLATAAVIAVVATTPGALLTRGLSWRPLRYVGRISYGLYLYHWPIALILDQARTGLSGVALLGARVGATLLLGAVSFRWWERPLRARRWLNGWRALVLTPAGLGALALALIGSTVVAPVAAALPADARPPARLAAPAGVSATHPERALLLGDSLALTLGWGLGRDASGWGVQLLNKGDVGCDLDPTTTVRVMGVVSRAAQGCPHWRTTWAHLVAQTNPDVVLVLLGRWECLDRVYDGRWTHLGQRAYDQHLLRELEEVIDVTSSHGARVVMLTLPYVQQTTEQPDGAPWPMNRPARTDVYNALVRQAVAARPRRATVFDLNHVFDPQGHYTSYVSHVRVRSSDDEHISPAGGALLRNILLPRLLPLGIEHARARWSAASVVSSGSGPGAPSVPSAPGALGGSTVPASGG